jgi:hypothetical protein
MLVLDYQGPFYEEKAWERGGKIYFSLRAHLCALTPTPTAEAKSELTLRLQVSIYNHRLMTQQQMRAVSLDQK